MELKAALYMRSSKDRNDVSIAAQRRSLQEFAISLNATIVAEFADPVESGRDYYRPGFQKMMTELKSPARAWNTILMVDTARLARIRYIGESFKHEAKKYGADVRYKTIPEVDGVSRILMEAVFTAMDEIYSLTAREKGIAGQVENIKNGYRAGGRAPKGYQLEKIDTGSTRDGQPVYKTKLIPSEDAAGVTRYLKARAAGNPRGRSIRVSGIDLPKTTASSMDWNALTYAGHTVYGMYAKHFNGAPSQGKRKPREDWEIKKNTHEAFITDEEALAILKRMETNPHGKAVSLGKYAASRYLLTGIMKTKDGRSWTGYTARGKYFYRIKGTHKKPGRYLPAEEIDTAVLTQIEHDISSPQFAEAMIDSSRKLLEKKETGKPMAKIEARISKINKKIERYIDLAAGLDDSTQVMDKINQLQREKNVELDELEKLKNLDRQKEAINQISKEEILAILQDRLNEMKAAKGLNLKNFILSLIEEITLDPVKLNLQITYRVSAKRSISMASPRGSVQWDMIGRSKPRKIQYFP